MLAEGLRTSSEDMADGLPGRPKPALLAAECNRETPKPPGSCETSEAIGMKATATRRPGRQAR